MVDHLPTLPYKKRFACETYTKSTRITYDTISVDVGRSRLSEFKVKVRKVIPLLSEEGQKAENFHAGSYMVCKTPKDYLANDWVKFGKYNGLVTGPTLGSTNSVQYFDHLISVQIVVTDHLPHSFAEALQQISGIVLYNLESRFCFKFEYFMFWAQAIISDIQKALV